MPQSRQTRGPAPGRPARGSKTGRPILALLDLLQRRPTLRILWELRGEPLTFRGLVGAADSNPGSLNRRLKELRDAGVVDAGPDGYLLTAEGRALMSALSPLRDWAEDWARRIEGPNAEQSTAGT